MLAQTPGNPSGAELLSIGKIFYCSGNFSGDSGSGPGGSPRTRTDPGSGSGLSTSGSCIAVSPGRSSPTGGQVSRA